jgi:hypothetical protein
MSDIPEIRVSSWLELNEELFAGSFDPDIQRYRSPFAFRGVGRVEAGLYTSLMRLGGNYAQIETHLLRNFRKYAQRDAVSVDSTWHWIALAQHYGLPTRLLDWTYSPYIAMHFATANAEYMHEDGVIWCVNFVQLKELLPQDIRDVLAEEGSDVFTLDMLNEADESLSSFETRPGKPFMLFVEPPSLDPRIVVQSALFTLMSKAMAQPQDFLREHSNICHRIIIPAEIKWEIRDKLDQANINERLLFPGLDGLSRWLRRYYGSKDSG